MSSNRQPFEKKNYDSWHLNNEGPHKALVLRFTGCSLRCPLCYSQRYAYIDPEGSKTRHYSLEECIKQLKSIQESAGWVRIQGGEPLLNDERALFTAYLLPHVMDYMTLRGKGYERPRIIIQTNGLWFNTGSKNTLQKFTDKINEGLNRNPLVKLAIEVSFKGPNGMDADAYGLSRNSEYVKPGKVFISQVSGYRSIEEHLKKYWERGVSDISLYPVGGLGAELDRPVFIPLSTNSTTSNEIPLFHKVTWDKEFVEIVKDFIDNTRKYSFVYNDYKKKHSEKVPLEGFDASAFQTAWMAQLNKRPELLDHVTRYLRINQEREKSLNYFKRYKELLDKIPRTGSNLVSKVIEMKVEFYCAEPKTHYPFL